MLDVYVVSRTTDSLLWKPQNRQGVVREEREETTSEEVPEL